MKVIESSYTHTGTCERSLYIQVYLVLRVTISVIESKSFDDVSMLSKGSHMQGS